MNSWRICAISRRLVLLASVARSRSCELRGRTVQLGTFLVNRKANDGGRSSFVASQCRKSPRQQASATNESPTAINKARQLAGFVVSAFEFCQRLLHSPSALPALRQQRIEHFDHQALLGLGQGLQAFQLLLQLRRGSALLGFRGFGHQRFDADAQRLRDQRQGRDLDAPSTDLVGGDGLPLHAEGLGELDLGDALLLAELGDAGAGPGRARNASWSQEWATAALMRCSKALAFESGELRVVAGSPQNIAGQRSGGGCARGLLWLNAGRALHPLCTIGL